MVWALMKNVFIAVAALLLLAGCDRISNAQIRVTTNASPADIVRNLNGMPSDIGLVRTKYWRQNGVFLYSENRKLSQESGEVAGNFQNDMQTYWDPTGADQGKLSIDFSIRTHGRQRTLMIDTGGVGVGRDRLPIGTIHRLANWLTTQYGSQNVTTCEDAFC